MNNMEWIEVAQIKIFNYYDSETYIKLGYQVIFYGIIKTTNGVKEVGEAVAFSKQKPKKEKFKRLLNEFITKIEKNYTNFIIKEV